MTLRKRDSEGNRWQLWPVRLSWGDRVSSCWFTTHGWQTGTEPTEDGSTAHGMMPGLRKVFGQTLHLGRLKVLFGKNLPPNPVVDLLLIRMNYEHLLRLLDVSDASEFKLTNEWSAAVREILRLQGRDKETGAFERVMASIGRPWSGRPS